MNTSRDPGFDPRIAAWLEDDPAIAPARVLETVLAAIPSVSQQRVAPGFPWRYRQMTASIRLVAGLAAALAIAIGAWLVLGGPRGSSVGASASPSSSSVPGGSLAGTSWIANVTASDLPQGAQPMPFGTWTMNFNSGAPGTPSVMLFLAPGGGGVSYPMTYVGSDEIALGPDFSCAQDEAKPIPSGESTYGFTVTGTTLTLRLVSNDPCAARVAKLTAHPWIKAP